jgi:hypothetical protein
LALVALEILLLEELVQMVAVLSLALLRLLAEVAAEH